MRKETLRVSPPFFFLIVGSNSFHVLLHHGSHIFPLFISYGEHYIPCHVIGKMSVENTRDQPYMEADVA